MDFGGINIIAVAVAAIAAFMLGGVYYGVVVPKAWMRAVGLTQADTQMGPGLFATTFICEFIMAAGIAGVVGHLGPDQVTLRNGLISGVFLALMLVVPAMVMNLRYQRKGWDLAVIDGIHWIAAAALMGAVIGWFGV